MGPGVRRHVPGGVHAEVLDRASRENLDVDWIGQRILRPEVDDVVNGAKGPLPEGACTTSTTRSPRYPSKGGFLALLPQAGRRAPTSATARSSQQIDFGKQHAALRGRHARSPTSSSSRPSRCRTSISRSTDAPDDVREAAALLRSTQFYRVDVAVEPPAPARGDLVLRLRRGQAVRPHQRHGAVRPEQRARGQDRHPGRGLRLGVEAAAPDPETGEAAGHRRAARDGAGRRARRRSSPPTSGSCPPARSSTT